MKSWYITSTTNVAGQAFVADENTGRTVAVVYDKKDAALVAAAPKLLAALEEVADIWNDLYSNAADPYEKLAWRKANEAIKEAKGWKE